LKSYFFIPGNNLKFLVKASEITASEIIIDLEDSIYNDSIQDAIANILNLELSKKFFIRLQLDTDVEYLEPLLKAGYSRFVIPKIESSRQLDEIVKRMISCDGSERLELIILIENPQALYSLGHLLAHPHVVAVGLGSHDYCASVGMKHTLPNLYWCRMQLLNTSLSFGKEVIDIASMNISDEDVFVSECKDGIDKGFLSKFIIHPWQLNLYHNTVYYDKLEVDFAILVRDHIQNLGGIEYFTIAKVGDTVVEKPHLKRLNNILKNSGNETF
jgi:citrate lyase beta subunit